VTDKAQQMVRQAHHRKDIVVIGLGNVLLSDEGIGVHLLKHLSSLAEKYPNVDFVDAGTGGMNILHLLEGKRKAVIIDCANMGAEPGRIKKFTPDQALSVKSLAHYSLHEQDLLRIIDFAKKLEQCPQDIVIFGIQPEIIEPGIGLSETLIGKVEYYVSVVCRELES
jgi:hydrogenase maturation protease